MSFKLAVRANILIKSFLLSSINDDPESIMKSSMEVFLVRSVTMTLIFGFSIRMTMLNTIGARIETEIPLFVLNACRVFIDPKVMSSGRVSMENCLNFMTFAKELGFVVCMLFSNMIITDILVEVPFRSDQLVVPTVNPETMSS